MIGKFNKQFYDCIFPIGCVICLPIPEPPDVPGIRWALITDPEHPCAGPGADENVGRGIHNGEYSEHKHVISIDTAACSGDVSHTHRHLNARFGTEAAPGDKSRVGAYEDAWGFVRERGPFNQSNGNAISSEMSHEHESHIRLVHETEGREIDHEAVIGAMQVSGYYYERIA